MPPRKRGGDYIKVDKGETYGKLVSLNDVPYSPFSLGFGVY